MKMKASELRIGNYVNTPRADQNPFRIDYFDIDKVYQNNGTYKTDFGGIEYTIPFHPLTWDLKDCSPIPLTPEILEKAGFEKKYDGDYFTLPDELCKGGWDKRFIYYLPYFNLSTYTGNIQIAHLHQLQNLYFALTGQELAINL